MLRHRHHTGDTDVVEPEDHEPAEETSAEVPDDPRLIRDDGTLVTDEDLVWAYQPSVATAPVAPVAPAAAPNRRRLTWGQVLIVLAGGASLVFGIGAVALAGLAGPVTEPLVGVFSFRHSPLLGLIEIAAGAVLVLTGLVRGGRWIAGPIGVGAIVGGAALIVAELDWTRTELGAQQRFGWVPIIIGAAAYLGAMVPGRPRASTTR